jgi:hypothetical protein
VSWPGDFGNWLQFEEEQFDWFYQWLIVNAEPKVE